MSASNGHNNGDTRGASSSQSAFVSSEEINLLIYRYLQESGFVHTAFVFAYEGLIGRSSLKNTDIPPGALISFLQKGLQYLGIEENLNADGSERKKKKRKSSSKSSAITSGNPAEQNNNSDEESSASVPPTEPFTLLSPHARKAIGKREMPIRLNVPPASAAAAIRAKIAKDDAAGAAAAKAGRNAISSSQQQQSQLPPVLSSSSTSNSKSKPTKTLNAVSSEELTNKSNDSSSTGKVSSKSKKNSSNNNLAPPTMGTQQAPSLATTGGVGGPNNFHLAGQGLVPGGPGSSGASVPGQQQLWNAHDENQRVHALANVASGLSAAAAAAANAGSPFSLMPSGGVMSAQQQNNPQISMHNKFNPEHPPVDANKSNPSNTFGHPVMPTQQPHPDPKKEHNFQGPNNTTTEGTLAEYNQTQVLPHEILELRKHTSEVFMCSWNQTYPNLIATGSGDASARIWSMNGSTASAGCGSSRLLKHGDATDKNKDVTTLEWSPDGNYLATGSYDGVARVWTKVGDLVHTLVTHRGPIFSLKWNKRGNYLLSGSYDKTTIVWDVSGKEAFVKQQFNHHFAPALDVDWKDNDTFASCSTDKVVHVCRVGATNPLITFSGHTDEVNAVKWDPSGNLLASCSDDCTAKVWDVGRNHDSAPLFDFRSHQQEIYTVKWSPTGEGSKNPTKPLMLASASFDGTVRLWNIQDGTCIRVLSKHKDSVYSVSFSSSGEFLASGSLAGQLYIWSIRDGRHIKSYKGEGDIFEVAWNVDETRVAACFSSNVVAVIDMQGITS